VKRNIVGTETWQVYGLGGEFMKPLRDDPRFAELVKRISLS